MSEQEIANILKYYDEYLDILLDLDHNPAIRNELMSLRLKLRNENPNDWFKKDKDFYYNIEAKVLLKYIELCKQGKQQ